jgi:hypothetical protein
MWMWSPLAKDSSVFGGGRYLLDLVDYVIIAISIVVMAVPEVFLSFSNL